MHNKKIIASILCTALISGVALGVIITPKNNITISYDFANKKVASFKSLDVTDPYFTGSSKVSYAGSRYYQNISYNHIAKNMKNVWNTYTGEGVKVAVIDTGLDINHPDFQEHLDPESAYFYTRYNSDYTQHQTTTVEGIENLAHDKVLDEKTNKYYLESHGTNTAGALAAEMNGEGTVGVAPNVTLLALKVDLDDYSIDRAIKYAVDHDAKVINMSFGGYAEKYYDHRLREWCSEDDYDPVNATSLIEALTYAHANDVILVAAAGNECTPTHSYPACNEYVIGVGALATDSGTTKADYSNYNLTSDTPDTNPSVDVVAPGTVVVPECELDTLGRVSSTYTINFGTSFSAPIVAGMAALWKEKYPEGTPLQFEDALYNTCKDLGIGGWDDKFGYGSAQVDALLAYDIYQNPVDEVRATSIKFTRTIVTVDIDESYETSVVIEPEGVTNRVSYTSSDDSIAYVSNSGVITGVKTGACTITATIDGLSATVAVSVGTILDTVVGGFLNFCGGNAVTTSSILSLISLIGIALLLNKKRLNK